MHHAPGPQVPAVEIRPKNVLEDHLGVGALPDQVVRGALLAAGPHEEVHVRHVRVVRVLREGLLVDLGRVQLPGRHVLGDALRGVRDLGAAAVVDAEVQRHLVVVLRLLLGDLELLDDGLPQLGHAAHPADADAELVHLVAAAADHVAVEVHQELHLVRRALPVLRGEGVEREVLHAHLDTALEDVHDDALTDLVALGAGQAPLLRPAAVAVHHDGDVLGHQLTGDLRRRRARGVRLGGLVRAPVTAAEDPAYCHVLLSLPVSLLHAPRRLPDAPRHFSTYRSERRPRSRCQCR